MTPTTLLKPTMRSAWDLNPIAEELHMSRTGVEARRAGSGPDGVDLWMPS